MSKKIVGHRTVAGSGEKTVILADETSDWRQRELKAYQERTLDEDTPELKPYLPRGGSVLDVGCGSGGITLGVATAIAPRSIDWHSRAREMNGDLSLDLSDAELGKLYQEGTCSKEKIVEIIK